MFDNLVESGSHKQDVARKGSFILITLAVYAVLIRLEEKGFVRSILGDATPVRGGKRKRLFEPTAAGLTAIRDLRRVRDRLWQAMCNEFAQRRRRPRRMVMKRFLVGVDGSDEASPMLRSRSPSAESPFP